MTSPQEPDHHAHPSAPPFGGFEPQGAPAPRVERPREVTVAFWVWVSGAVLFSLFALVSFTQLDAATDLLVEGQQYPDIPREQLVPLVTTVLIVTLVLTVVFAVLAVLFAHHARLGKPWARVALTVLACLALAYLVFSANVVTLLLAIIPAVGVGALYTPKAKAYFEAGRYR